MIGNRALFAVRHFVVLIFVIACRDKPVDNTTVDTSYPHSYTVSRGPGAMCPPEKVDTRGWIAVQTGDGKIQMLLPKSSYLIASAGSPETWKIPGGFIGYSRSPAVSASDSERILGPERYKFWCIENISGLPVKIRYGRYGSEREHMVGGKGYYLESVIPQTEYMNASIGGYTIVSDSSIGIQLLAILRSIKILK